MTPTEGLPTHEEILARLAARGPESHSGAIVRELLALRETVARLPAEIERQRLDALEGSEGGDMLGNPEREAWRSTERRLRGDANAYRTHYERVVTERDAAREALRKIEKARTGTWEELRREDQRIAFDALWPESKEAPNA